MAYKIIFKKRFIAELEGVLHYLEKEWGKTVADGFLTKIEKTVESLRHNAFIGAPSTKIKDARGLSITAHNRLFYRVKGNSVSILRLLDTRTRNY